MSGTLIGRQNTLQGPLPLTPPPSQSPLLSSITPNLIDVDLSSNGLTSSSIIQLSSSLPSSSITNLNLARNTIDDKGALSLLAVLGRCKLKSLCLSGNKIGDKGIQGFSEYIPSKGQEGLAQAGQGLQQQQQQQQQQSPVPIPPPTARPEVASPRASLTYVEPPLESLNLSSNQITTSGFLHLAQFLSSGPFKLGNLDVSWNTGGDLGCLAIVNSLGRKGNNRMQSLNLAFNGITDEGGARVVSTLIVFFGGEIAGMEEENTKRGKRQEAWPKAGGVDAEGLGTAFRSISSTLRDAEPGNEQEGGSVGFAVQDRESEDMFCTLDGVPTTFAAALTRLDSKHGPSHGAISSYLSPLPPPMKSINPPSLTHLTLSRNRLGPATCLSLSRLLSMPKLKAKQRKKIRMTIRGKFRTSRRARGTGGGGTGGEGGQWKAGCTLTHLDVGFNPLGGEGTGLVVGARGKNIQVLRIENTHDGDGGVGIEGEGGKGGGQEDRGPEGGGKWRVRVAVMEGITVTDFPGARKAVNPKKWKKERGGGGGGEERGLPSLSSSNDT